MCCMVHYLANGPMWRLWSGKLMVQTLAFWFRLNHLHICEGMLMHVQICRTLRVPCSLYHHPNPPCFREEVKEEVSPLSPQREQVMRFCAPSITRRMRNLIIKERHVAVRKICLFVLFFFLIVSPRETKVTPMFRSLNLACSNLSR